jgi:hypothetical protein
MRTPTLPQHREHATAADWYDPRRCPPPPDERQQLQHEFAELLVQLGSLRDELEGLEAGPASRFRRSRLARQAESLECRLVDLQARWAALPPDG